MKKKRIAGFIPAIALILGMSLTVMADTIRLKDGTVIRGQITGFRDQQFTVLIGSGARGRRSQITLYIEDVESIEFDGAAAGNTTGAETPRPAATAAGRPAPAEPRATEGEEGGVAPRTTTANAPRSSPAPGSSAPFFKVNVRVRADNAANGWTNSGLVVRRGQRLRINSTGRISLGQGRFSTPTGLPRLADENKLMRDEPTGALIAVIGDDNDEFVLIGSTREFTATRDGVLFLGINEGNLNDNTGAYEAVIEAEAVSGGGGGAR